MKSFKLTEETLGYVTSQDESNTDKRFLVEGSQNVLIDQQKKVKSRSGYSLLGALNTALYPNRNGWTWTTPPDGTELLHRYNEDKLEVYLGTIDGYAVNAWKQVIDGLSLTEKLRKAYWWDTTESLELELMVNGDANIYAWNGAVAVVDSVTANTIKKKGTSTFANNRFFVNGNKTLINVRTGTEFSYTAGEGTTTLTGVSGSPVTDGMVAGDVLVQKVITNSDKPAALRNNHTIFSIDNQIYVGSKEDNLVYVSANDDYTDFTYSTPRVTGEGTLLTLDAPNVAIESLGKYPVIFCGDYIYKIVYNQIDVGGVLTEQVQVERIDTAVDQGALSQEAMVSIGNAIAYLTNEVTLRIVENPDDLTGINPKTLSNPIKPDFDAEDWDDAQMYWYKNILLISASSHLYMLNFVQDADGRVFRYWNPPQILPVGAMAKYNSGLYGFSDSTPEVYKLFDGASDKVYSGMAVKDKLPISTKAVFAYNNYKEKARLKTFDEKFVEGDITQNTKDLKMTIEYDYGGATQVSEYIIDGSDEDILEGNIGFNSLAQQSLAVNPLGGLLNPPDDARRFRTIFEIPKEDFFEIRTTFETNDVDRYWAIISHGENVELSKRKPTNKK